VALTKLRMFCTHPFLVDRGTGDPLPHSTKYARLVEILDEVFAGGEKVLIFTSYTAMADILAADLARRYGIPVDVIDGRTPVTDRQPTVDRFGQVATAAALVLNPKAAGTGLNITAANHVVHFNLEWNPAVEDQATARAHRRGQTRPVTVHRLFHPSTVEEVIDQRTQRKRAIAAEAVVGTEGGADDLADIAHAMQLSPVLKESSNAR
jgi:SNF2 family DNA or RNA helicase